MKNLGGKYSALNLQMDKIIHNANSEISSLRTQMSSRWTLQQVLFRLLISLDLQIEKDSLRNKNEELSHAFREKTRKHLQTQEMFDKMKRRSMLGHVQNAASDAVEHSIQASVAENRYVDSVDQTQRPPPPPLFSGQQPSISQNQGSGNPPNLAPQNMGNWNGYDGQEPRQEPSQRMCLPQFSSHLTNIYKLITLFHPSQLIDNHLETTIHKPCHAAEITERIVLPVRPSFIQLDGH